MFIYTDLSGKLVATAGFGSLQQFRAYCSETTHPLILCGDADSITFMLEIERGQAWVLVLRRA